jgi:hypothetical protein
MMMAILTAIPAVQHPMVCAACWTEVVTAAIVVAMAAMQVPGVGTTIGGIEGRTSEIEVVAVRIACIDAKVPVAGAPI